MEKHFIFDVDGTLTPSRGKMDGEFQQWFTNFCAYNNVYLVTGSDKLKTIEQIGSVIFGMCQKSYNCSGNDVYQYGVNIHKSEWKLSQEQKDWLNEKLESSVWETKTGKHLEERTGCANFSIVGRNADFEQRKLYYTWDCKTKERETISKEFNEKFTQVEAKIGGETGFDIFPKGKDKLQILEDFPATDKVYFFGDRVDPAGNDYTLARGVFAHGDWKNGKVYHVSDWEETFKILKTDLKNIIQGIV